VIHTPPGGKERVPFQEFFQEKLFVSRIRCVSKEPEDNVLPEQQLLFGECEHLSRAVRRAVMSVADSGASTLQEPVKGSQSDIGEETGGVAGRR